MWSQHASAGHVRNIVVPHDIIAVPRRSPIKVRKRTPWHPAKSPVVVERSGCREWFSDRLFVESRQANLPAACSTSAIVHVALVAIVLFVLVAGATRAELTPRIFMDVSLRMPSLESVMPVAVASPPEWAHAERESPVQPAPPKALLQSRSAAPLETPSSVVAEPTRLGEAPEDAAVAAEVTGATDGVAGGVIGGTGSDPAVEPVSPPAATGPLQVGDGVDRPRKIKHVKPVYPLPAMSARVGGNVLIEAIIGADGKVRDARVVKSIAVLDQAALDAVRQWEFEPSRLNGMPVAVSMIIIVTFALL